MCHFLGYLRKQHYMQCRTAKYRCRTSMLLNFLMCAWFNCISLQYCISSTAASISGFTNVIQCVFCLARLSTFYTYEPITESSLSVAIVFRICFKISVRHFKGLRERKENLATVLAFSAAHFNVRYSLLSHSLIRCSLVSA